MTARRIPGHPRFDLRQLRTFVAVAELGSISKAACFLHTVQPALSRQLRMLENELGVRLVARHPRGVSITPAGELLRQRALELLRAAGTTKADVAAAAGRITGDVGLGLVPSVGSMFSVLAESFCTQHPDATLRITEELGANLVDQLREGLLDLAVVYSPAGHQDLVRHPLLIDPMWLIGPANAGFRRDRPVPLSTLESLPMVLPGPGHGLRDQIDEICAARGVALHVRIETQSIRIQKELVRRNVGYAIGPYAAVHEEVANGSLSAARITDPDIERELVLAMAADRPLSYAALKLREMLIPGITQSVDTDVWPGARLPQLDE